MNEPPLIRVAKGDFRYWAANERWQCTWHDERGSNSSGSNTTGSATQDPDKSTNGLGDYIARVKVCDPTLIGTEKCRRYPSGNYKPIGLLHEYGEDDRILFGLLTGSYKKNKSGGVLRKNASSFTNEVNKDTDGTFTDSEGIVKTLNRFRITRYDYGDGTYVSTDKCGYRLASFNDGECSNWGNPLSEIYLESLRYFGGLTSSFAADDSAHLSGIPAPAWVDPLDEDNWCAHCDIILINASESSYDHDAMDASGLSGAPDAASLTDDVGDAEGISGNAYFVGENGSDNNQLCTAKTITGLGDVRGACPGAPRLSGTYLSAGLAHWAHTKDIRALKGKQKVTTRAVALLPGVPKLVIPVPGAEPKRTVSILPACRNLNKPTDTGMFPSNCAIVDFKLIEQDIENGTGTVYVNWENSEQGGDYDQDMKGTLSYSINAGANTITVTTDTDAQSANDVRMGFGYIISGTSQDGFHVHSGANGFSQNDPTGVLACNNCQISDAPTSYTYTLGASSAGLLEQPLWYAAKYGSFNDSNGNDIPDLTAEWDADQDGQPDGFFLANDPAALGPSLARFLDVIFATTSSSSVATNSVTLNTDTRIYQGRYDSGDWSGDLVAFPINADGTIAPADWHARDRLNAQSQSNTRRIVTTNEDSGAGVPFRWGDATSDNDDGIADAQKQALRKLCPTCNLEDESVGQDRLDYIRGNDSNEVASGGSFRNREYKLGDIADSDPVFVGAPNFHYPDASYQTFANDHDNRKNVIYVGANDGMLHGFDADTGDEVFAYVPRAVYPHLSKLTTLDYKTSHRFYVNGSPGVGDVFMRDANAWRTVLVGGLGAGGAGVYALDVTEPQQLAIDETTAAGHVLWDVTDQDSGFEDLGLTFGKPVLVRLPDGNHDGRWVAVFGNGYHESSDEGKAVLYVVDAETGDLLSSVVASNGPGNGLSSVAPVDYDGDRVLDYIYAGDLKGNLWRFEPDGSDAWKVSFGGDPLFKNGTADIEVTETTTIPQEVCETVTETVCVKYTWKGKCQKTQEISNVVCHTEYVENSVVTVVEGDSQPITVRPEAMRHPDGGVMILFGTGSFYRDSDREPNPDDTNAIYGIWDKPNGEGGIRTQHLLMQDILAEQTVGDYEVRVTTGNPITWHTEAGKPQDVPPSTHLGWYLELLNPDGTGNGEMQVTDPLVRDGRLILTTMIPSDLACDFGGEGWLMELDALTGRPIDGPLFDLNGDGEFDASDLAIVDINGEVKVTPAGVKSPVGIIQEPTVIGAGTMEYLFSSGAKDGEIWPLAQRPGDLLGRSSWLQLQ